MLENYLQRLQQAEFDVFHPSLFEKGRFGYLPMQLQLVRHRLMNTF